MAITKLNIAWYGQSLMDEEEYGIVQIAKNAWLVVEADHTKPMGFRTLTQVETRQAAIGFLKLLKEN
jgi:hypothetical protein